MGPVKPCQTYRAVLSSREVWRPAAGGSVFKVYFLDIVGRAEPSRTVWSASGMKKAEFLARLPQVEGIEGVGFITAFPHIAKCLRFGPETETNLNVRAWNTRDMTPLALSRGEGYSEFACLAEAVIAADEFGFWASAASVEEWLLRWSVFEDERIARHDKLAQYWGAAQGRDK